MNASQASIVYTITGKKANEVRRETPKQFFQSFNG